MGFQLIKYLCVFHDLCQKFGIHEDGFVDSIKLLLVTKVIYEILISSWKRVYILPAPIIGK
jgi:hypothetical protein